MTFINYAAREINCKIVYYGPGLCGKTTNLQWIYDKTNPQAKGKLISLATETERTLFFDFLPVDLGTIRGFKTRFHLYTVPGQVFYDASRKLILKGVEKRDADYVFATDALAELQEFDRAKLGPQEQITYDILLDFYGQQAKFREFEWLSSEGLYPISPMFGTQVQLASFMQTLHVVKNEKTARNYVARLRAMGTKLDGLTAEMTARVVSLSGGALFANVVSVIILISETIMQRR